MLKVRFNGPMQYRVQSMAMISRAIADVTRRRALRGPKHPQWNVAMEAGTEILKRRLQFAFKLQNAAEARRYLDTVELRSVEVDRVAIEPVNAKGEWVRPLQGEQKVTILYLHGGGFAFYPKAAYRNMTAALALATNARIFAVDYRLSPEHSFPAQLQDVLAAYRWLLESGVNPAELVVAGDSAGANLTIALLLAARDSHLSFPALGVALSPATDFEADPAYGAHNAEYDWITADMLRTWGGWYCPQAEWCNPAVSVIRADLSGLPPIYMQAGEGEILYPSIAAFAESARRRGANVVLESWPGMNHVFQLFGNLVPQSAAALKRIAEEIAAHVPAHQSATIYL